MYKKITLASNSVFYYKPSTYDEASWAFIVDINLNFLGGFLCNEADRKYAAFSKLSNVRVEDSANVLDLNLVKFDNFAASLGTASNLFLSNWSLMISDRQDCDGTSSYANSCDERGNYYKAVGCWCLFKSNTKFPLWAFVANHVSIFSVKDFRTTFFKGYEENPEKDIVVGGFKTRYSNDYFKAPAAYVRALCQNK